MHTLRDYAPFWFKILVISAIPFIISDAILYTTINDFNRSVYISFLIIYIPLVWWVVRQSRISTFPTSAVARYGWNIAFTVLCLVVWFCLNIAIVNGFTHG